MSITHVIESLTLDNFPKVVRARDRARVGVQRERHLQTVAKRERVRGLAILQYSHACVDADALHAITHGWSESEFVLFRKEQTLSAILDATRHARDSGDGPPLKANALQLLAYLRGVLSERVLTAAYRRNGVFRRLPLDWTVAQLISYLQQQHFSVRTRIARRIASDPTCSFVTAPFPATTSKETPADA